MNEDAFLKMDAVRERTALSRSEIYHRIKHGNFPAGIRVGPRLVAWSRAEVDMWIRRTVATSPRVKA